MNVSKLPDPSEGPGPQPPGSPATVQSELQAAQADLRALRRELETAREARRRQSEILRDVLYSSTVATFLLGPSLQLEFFTPAAEAMFRVLSSDVGRPFSELALAGDDAGLEADIQAVMAGHERERSGVVAMHDRWYARKVLARRSREQGGDGVVVSYEDITDGVAAGQLADAAREQIRRLIGTMQVPVAMFDDGLVLLAANPRFEVMLVNHRHLLQHAIAEMRQVAPPADRAEFTIEVEGLGPLQFVLGSMTWAAEPARRLHMVSVDVDRLGGRSGGALIADAARLSEARHEISQPLQSLRLLHDVLLRRSTDPAEIALLGRLEEASEALTGLLDSMFLQEELHRDSLMAHPDQDVAVRDVTRSLRLELGYHAAAKGVAWRAVDCSLRVRSDPRLLACLIRSLVVHALRRTSGGALLLGCRRTASGVRLEIWLGKGETAAAASMRHDPMRPHEPPAVAVALARILNADISLGEGQGPACSIFLPVGAPATGIPLRSPQPAPHTAAPAAEPTRRTVCLVDDDENFLRSVEMALDHVAIDVIAFRDADTFLERYRGIAAECLFIDAQMPGMDGFRLIERLRHESCTLPYIMITGAGDVQLAVRAMRAGAADFIEKPLTIDQLVESMNRARDQSRPRLQDGETSPELSFQPGTHAYDPRPRMLQLTPRQIQVMDLVVEGHANKEIAARLRISQRTVENHRAAVMQRMGARSLSHLIRMRLSPPVEHIPE